ncbi:MAG: hypothetical protein J6J86_05110 [Lachnospiraceae bacterium]|nr:hypothetical protein [Lachnospiraceae bacterium]
MRKMNLQFFAGTTPVTGVTPTCDVAFSVNTKGRTGKAEDFAVVKDAESLSISIDGNIEKWNPMDAAGWGRALMTSKSMSISMGGKRNYGDPGNDYVASCAFKNGQDCNSQFKIIFPNGDALEFDCIIDVKSLGGDSTAVNALEWEAVSDGKPKYVPYSESGTSTGSETGVETDTESGTDTETETE